MSFAGNKEIAKKELQEILFQGLKASFSRTFSWNLPSEIKLLELLEKKAMVITDNSFADFIELPVSCWRYVPTKGDASFPSKKILELTLAEISGLWDTRTKYNSRRLKTIRNELKKRFDVLQNQWRQPENEQEKCSPPSTGNSRRFAT